MLQEKDLQQPYANPSSGIHGPSKQTADYGDRLRASIARKMGRKGQLHGGAKDDNETQLAHDQDKLRGIKEAKMVPISKEKLAIAKSVKNQTAPKNLKTWNNNRNEDQDMSEIQESDYKSRFKPDHEPNSKDREGRINRRSNHQINAANDEKKRRETGYSPTKREIRNQRLNKEEYNMSEAVQDIINLTLTGSPVEVKAALEVAITEKIGAALEAKKAVIANSLVGIGESFPPAPSAIHSDEKSDRAKRIAMNKIKSKAKDEGVDMSDEDAEELLESLLEDFNDDVPMSGGPEKDKTWHYRQTNVGGFATGSTYKNAKIHRTGGKYNVMHGDKHAKTFNSHGEAFAHLRDKGYKEVAESNLPITKETLDYVREWFTEEELDELSRKTMANYVKKAIPDKELHQTTLNYPGRAAKVTQTATRKLRNRTQGIDRALNKLGKD